MNEPIARTSSNGVPSLHGPERIPDTVNRALEQSRMDRFAIAQALARRLRETAPHPPAIPVSLPHQEQREASSFAGDSCDDDLMHLPQEASPPEADARAAQRPRATGVDDHALGTYAQAGFWD